MENSRLYLACDYLSMLGLNLIQISKIDPRQVIHWGQDTGWSPFRVHLLKHLLHENGRIFLEIYRSWFPNHHLANNHFNLSNDAIVHWRIYATRPRWIYNVRTSWNQKRALVIFQVWFLFSTYNKMVLYIHYNDVIMSVMASQITSLTIVCSTVNSGKWKKTAKLRFTGLCEENSPVTG